MTMQIEDGIIATDIQDGIGRITFGHVKANSLTSRMLAELAARVTAFGADPAVRVIILQSTGESAFCAGASFDEFKTIDGPEKGRDFFMGFARLILAMRLAPKFIVTRIQAKAVGGGVGIAAASDYALATHSAALKLSEFALGLGPFVIGPCVERRIGSGPFSHMSIDTDWRSSEWGLNHGLYVQVFQGIAELDSAIDAIALRLSQASMAATAELKRVFWEGTENWETLLPERASISGRLLAEHRELQSAKSASF